MAFWGVEVKSGKSYTHSCKNVAGRLRLSQATLGFGEATKKSVVQCNVGSKSPVLLCVLTPNQRESCHLDLEFEEADDVVFSVIGPRSVFLAGYYVQHLLQPTHQSDTESYGEDIENTQSEESNRCSDDDNYEDSFIDDQDLRVSSLSPSHVSSVKENDKLGERNSHGKRRKEKYKIFDSDSDSKSSGRATTTTKLVEDLLTEDVDCLINGKHKKKRKYSVNEKIHDVENEKDPSITDEETLDDDSRNMKRLVTASESDPEKSKRSKRRRKDLQSDESKENEGTKVYSGTTKENEMPGDRTAGTIIAETTQPETKTKKLKKKKSQGDEHSLCSLATTDNLHNSQMKSNVQIADADPTQRRTLSNGLVIEDISFGPPDGKVATAGRTVKIYYSVTSKETGRILYSNTGETASKFSLGVDENLDGWKCGIIGMRVGDKRRVVVPPSMRFVENVAWEENVPPSSWLVYEVELVAVRRPK